MTNSCKRRTKWLIAAAIVLALAGPWLVIEAQFQWQLSQNKQDPQQLLIAAKVKGGSALAHDLSANEHVWHNVLDGIRTADQAWLDVADELVESHGAHTLEELYGALSVALDNSPEKVLLLSRVKPEIVCSFFDEHSLIGKPNLAAIHDRRVRTISAIQDSRLALQKIECLSGAAYLLKR